ncbi:MAG: phosphoglucomutase/phosphomannomutase family protein [Acidobacteria bacterium]|nr:phosphoglucomutase/phosphomannomutase family protein [Acidobacteriota bacterium]MBI3663641.1 phosphoglucomutase/phosphomannomutase family protein [Acidobacteriota bacterium]
MTGNRIAPPPIKFGTSGWRAIIADQFTFANVRLAVEAIAGHVLSNSKKPVLIVGHDPRFFSEDFAAVAATVLRARGVRVLLCEHSTPTPAISYEILRRKTDGAINFTASHNPAEYHGLKFSGPDGGPALPEVTKDIEARVARLAGKTPEAPAHGAGSRHDGVERIDPRPAYLARLMDLVNFAVLRSAKLNLVCDPLHGCGAGYLDRVLAGQGIPAHSIRTNRDVLFDGQGPDVSDSNLAPLRVAVLERGANAGLATDGDADRFGVIDADGSFVQPNHVLALLYDYIVDTRGWKLGTARSVATTHLLDAVAKVHGQPVYQTPVGFKYIGELVKRDKIALGGEESAGLSIRGHVPEKDGILACLLVAEMIATRRASLAEQLRALFRKVGAEFWPVRVNLHLPGDVQAQLVERLKGNFASFLGRRVAKADRTDGLKLILEDGTWALMRLSGTEPLVRVYTEAGSREAANSLAAEVQKWVFA